MHSGKAKTLMQAENRARVKGKKPSVVAPAVKQFYIELKKDENGRLP